MSDNKKLTESEGQISRRKALGYTLAGVGGCLLPNGLVGCVPAGLTGQPAEIQAAGANIGAANTVIPYTRGAGRYTNWKTHCVGRYLVDTPSDAIVTHYPLINKHKFERIQSKSSEDAAKMADAKITELKNTHHMLEGNYFIKSIPLANGGVLVQGWEIEFTTEYSLAYLYIPVTSKEGTVVCVYKDTVFTFIEDKILQELVTFGSSFKAFSKDSIPTEAGFCFENILIANVPFSEQCGFGIDDPKVPGLRLAFRTTSLHGSMPWRWLTQRVDLTENCREIQHRGSCDRLRFGKHDAGIIPGEEVCLAGKHEGRRTYLFEWDNPGKLRSKTAPNLLASILYQEPPFDQPTAPPPFASDKEALEVWDKFVSTIRIRPVS